MRRSTLAITSALLLPLGLALSACNEDEPAPEPETSQESEETEETEAPEETDDSAAGSGDYTDPGTELGFGEEAAIPLSAGSAADVNVALSDIEAGDPADIADVEGAEGMAPFYLHWEFTGAAGAEELAHATPSRAQFRALLDDDRVAGFMTVVGTFEPCDMEPFPGEFGEGDTHEVCMVAVAPDGSEVTQGLWGEGGTDYDFTTGAPIIWRQ